MNVTHAQTPPDLVDIFEGADPGYDSPTERAFQCEFCGYWTRIAAGVVSYDLRCGLCGDPFLRTSHLMSR